MHILSFSLGITTFIHVKYDSRLLHPDKFNAVYGLFLFDKISLFIVDVFQKINPVSLQNIVMHTVLHEDRKVGADGLAELTESLQRIHLCYVYQMFEMDHHVIFPLLQCFLFFLSNTYKING